MEDKQDTSSTNELKYLNKQCSIDVDADQTILEAFQKVEIDHPHVCGGNAMCSSCRVMIEKGMDNCSPRNEKELLVAKKLSFDPQLRLACQTTLCGNVSISKPDMDDIDIEIACLTIAERGENKIGEEKDLTIMFADIEGYTAFTESVHGYDLVHVINRYYYLMGNIIKKNKGTIIDYYGDGLLTVFGLENAESMEFDAVTAGICMMKELESFNDYLYKFLNHKFKIRVGIHTGKVIVGNIGFKGSRKLAVIGDAVNFASRIDHVNKELKTHFLVSESTYSKVAEDFPFDQMHEVEVKGKKGKHQVFELNKF